MFDFDGSRYPLAWILKLDSTSCIVTCPSPTAISTESAPNRAVLASRESYNRFALRRVANRCDRHSKIRYSRFQAGCLHLCHTGKSRSPHFRHCDRKPHLQAISPHNRIHLNRTPHRREGSGYKEYDDATIEPLSLIRKAKILGFTLAEIQQSISAWQNGELSRSEKIKLVRGKIEQVDEKIQELTNMRIYLLDKLEKIDRE